MKVNYTIINVSAIEVESGHFEDTDTIEVYAFLKRAESALVAGHVVTVVKGDE